MKLAAFIHRIFCCFKPRVQEADCQLVVDDKCDAFVSINLKRQTDKNVSCSKAVVLLVLS